MDLHVQYAIGSICNSTELDEKAISNPNRQGLSQEDVEWIITDKWIKDPLQKKLLWTPPVRYLIRKGQRLACEKHMDWWAASTKPILERYAIKDFVQPLQ